MMSIDSSTTAELFARVSKSLDHAISLRCTIVRSVGTRYASELGFLSGEGAAKMGGRWNPRGIRAVYGSLDVITATCEAYQNFVDYGFPLSNVLPRVMAGAEADLQAVLDLTKTVQRRKLGVPLRDLVNDDWHKCQAEGKDSTTQIIARACHFLKLEGLLVPSARRKGGQNLVIFPDRLLPGSSLKLLGAKDLPPHPEDWP